MKDSMSWLYGERSSDALPEGDENRAFEESFADDPELLAQLLKDSQVICLLEMVRYERPQRRRVALSKSNRFSTALSSLFALAAVILMGCGIWWYRSFNTVGSLVAWNFHLESSLIEGLPIDDGSYLMEESGEVTLNSEEGEFLFAMRDEPLSWISTAVWEAEGSLE